MTCSNNDPNRLISHNCPYIYRPKTVQVVKSLLCQPWLVINLLSITDLSSASDVFPLFFGHQLPLGSFSFSAQSSHFLKVSVHTEHVIFFPYILCIFLKATDHLTVIYFINLFNKSTRSYKILITENLLAHIQFVTSHNSKHKSRTTISAQSENQTQWTFCYHSITCICGWVTIWYSDL